MLIQTIVDKSMEGAVRFERCTRDTEKDVLVTSELYIAPIDYDDAFVKTLTEEASKWYVHTTYIMDYESSTDAGDGRDDYSKEENDVEISLDDCIVKDGAFSGVICKAFDREDYILITDPKNCIGHPRNYSGRGYHSYRHMYFELLRK
ncbi:MAG: hypothetical protein E7471_05855 [Ruminococcaceae bacterium]|nr:hypothetical protein [Oscillospiraceae bacterium]